MNRTLTSVFVAALSVVWLPLHSPATTIIPTYVDSAGQTWDSVRQGVVQEAINEWQSNTLDNHTINITFDFTQVGTNGYLGQTVVSLSVPSGTNIYPWTPGVTQTIHFNADFFSLSLAHYTWWDPTPTSGNDLPQAAWDALSVARHELGHGLGFAAYTYYDNIGTPQATDKWTSHITGTAFDPDGLNVSMASTSDLSHVLASGLTAGDLMVPALVNGARHGISATDLNMLHLAYGYELVPEPSTLVLLAVGALSVLVYAGRRRRP